MTTQAQRPLDPEIQELLEEVARDPRSHLLRVPRINVPLAFEPAASPGAAFLTTVERRLLEVHRSEAARLLLEMVQRRVFEDPRSASRFHRSITVDRQWELTDPKLWLRRGQEQLRISPAELREDAAYVLLDECVRAPRDPAPSAVELAVASLRLVPRAETRIWLALALHQAEQTGSALSILHTSAAQHSSQLTHSIAWESIGYCQWELGRVDASLPAYRTASSSLESRSAPVMSWLLVALHAEQRASALEAAQRLGDLVPEHHPSVDELIRVNRARARDGSWSASASSVRLARSIEDHVPAAAKRVIHAAF